MKTRIIDMLNKMADGTLEDGFKFKYEGREYFYSKKYTSIKDTKHIVELACDCILYKHLTDEVEVIEDETEAIEPFKTEYTMRAMDIEFEKKINELVRVVNELRKKK